MNGSYRVPDELKDEDKWFLFFTKKQLVYIIGSFIFAALFFLLFKKINLEIIGLGVGVFVILVTIIFAMIPIPPERYLMGGGYSMEVLAMRLLCKALRGKKLYVKNYSDSVEYFEKEKVRWS